MRNPGGYGIAIAHGDGKPLALRFDPSSPYDVTGSRFQVEVDTFTCGHCGSATWVRPKVDPADVGALCRKCMKVVCRKCVNLGRQTGITCDPLEEKLRRSEDKDRFRRSLNL